MEFLTAPLRNFFTRRYFDCYGRSSCVEYGSMVFWCWIILIATFVCLVILRDHISFFAFLSIFYSIGCYMIIPCINVTIRRLHDSNNSVAWVAVPVVAWILITSLAIVLHSPCEAGRGEFRETIKYTIALLPIMGICLLVNFTCLDSAQPVKADTKPQTAPGFMERLLPALPWFRGALACAVIFAAKLIASYTDAPKTALKYPSEGIVHWVLYYATDFHRSNWGIVHPLLWFMPFLAGLAALVFFSVKPWLWDLALLVAAAVFLSDIVQSALDSTCSKEMADLSEYCMHGGFPSGR